MIAKLQKISVLRRIGWLTVALFSFSILIVELKVNGTLYSGRWWSISQLSIMGGGVGLVVVFIYFLREVFRGGGWKHNFSLFLWLIFISVTGVIAVFRQLMIIS